METNYVTAFSEDLRNGISLHFTKERFEIVHHVEHLVGTFTLKKPASDQFLRSIVRAYCGPSVEPWLNPYNESIRLGAVLAREAFLVFEPQDDRHSIEYLQRVSDLALVFAKVIREGWNVR